MTVLSSQRALRRGWWLILLAIIGGLGVAGAVTAMSVPYYATTTTFFVTTPGTGSIDVMQGSTFSRDRIKSYVDLVRGDRLAGMVALRHPLGLSVPQIQDRISAVAVGDTVLLRVTVTDSDRNRSQRLAGAVLIELTSLVKTVEASPGADSPAVKLEVIAGPTGVPVGPQPLRNLGLGLLAGLLVGVTAAMLREGLDNSVKTPAELRQTTDVPVLAAVPHQASMAREPALRSGGDSPGAEAFRQLRTNLRSVDPTLRVLAVTSASSRDGRTTTAVNLAVMAAEAGRKVLLLEADLRRPRIAAYLGLTEAPGLAEVLAGHATWPEAVHEWGGSPLSVLPCGVVPPNPSELLDSTSMAVLLEWAREAFDLIVIDTPPLLALTDAAVVAAAADGAILVARANQTGQEQIREASVALRTFNGRLVGCVLNDVRRGDIQTAHRVSAPERARAGSPQATSPAPADGAATVDLDEGAAVDLDRQPLVEDSLKSAR